MASKYSSAFDDLLASGRRELDRMTGRDAAPPAGPSRPSAPAGVPASGPGSRTVEGTANGIPFRLRVRPKG